MSHFANFEDRPPQGGARFDAACVFLATGDDVDAIARISAERDGHDVNAILEPIRRDVEGVAEGTGSRVYVARVEGAVVAYGRVRTLTHERDGLPLALPEGWWLNGVIVRAGFRRRGLGAALTARRVDWVAGRADAVHYVSNVANRASHALHTAYGFKEIARGFEYPRAGLSGDQGVAFRARLGA